MPSEEMMRKFVEQGGAKPVRAKGKRQPGTTLAYRSAKKEVSDQIHDAYRDAFIYLCRRYDDLNCWECGIPCKPKQLDLHHIDPRARGGGHFAANYALVCNRFSSNGTNNCHDRITGKPMWGGSE